MDVPLISAKEISLYMDEKVRLIDMRSADEYEKCHLDGALSVPYDDDFASWRLTLPQNDGYILYCDRGNASLYAARQLSAQGVRVYAVAGGMEAIAEICKEEKVYRKTIDSKTTKR